MLFFFIFRKKDIQIGFFFPRDVQQSTDKVFMMYTLIST